jgi:hypothetical protein
VPTPDELSTIQYLRSQLGQATQDLSAVKGNLAVANSKVVQAAAREQYLMYELRSLSSELEGW